MIANERTRKLVKSNLGPESFVRSNYGPLPLGVIKDHDR